MKSQYIRPFFSVAIAFAIMSYFVSGSSELNKDDVINTHAGQTTNLEHNTPNKEPKVELGNFSVSLTVKDLQLSKAFYEKLGFTKSGGNESQNWLILQNETATIGLFQGMFDKNIMTFNPGWNRDTETLPEFEDIRDLQRKLKNQGIEFSTTADESTTGPASFTISDPDGNMILVDQHVDKPKN